MKHNCMKKLSSGWIERIHGDLLVTAWKSYTTNWTEADYEDAKNNQSCTSSIDEFEQCEFYDKEAMEWLLSPRKFALWKWLVKR